MSANIPAALEVALELAIVFATRGVCFRLTRAVAVPQHRLADLVAMAAGLRA